MGNVKEHERRKRMKKTNCLTLPGNCQTGRLHSLFAVALLHCAVYTKQWKRLLSSVIYHCNTLLNGGNDHFVKIACFYTASNKYLHRCNNNDNQMFECHVWKCFYTFFENGLGFFSFENIPLRATILHLRATFYCIFIKQNLDFSFVQTHNDHRKIVGGWVVAFSIFWNH